MSLFPNACGIACCYAQVVIKMDRGQTKAVKLAGLRASVDAAEARIKSLGEVAVRRVEVSPEEQPLLIGRNGSTIRELQESSGCSLETRKGVVTIAGAARPLLLLHCHPASLEHQTNWPPSALRL